MISHKAGEGIPQEIVGEISQGTPVETSERASSVMP